MTKTQPPKIGDHIYVGSALYLYHGRDDFCGGLATVTAVSEGISGGEKTHYVEVAEHLGTQYNWEFLAEEQQELRERFGEQRACPDPDLRPELNPPNYGY